MISQQAVQPLQGVPMISSLLVFFFRLFFNMVFLRDIE